MMEIKKGQKELAKLKYKIQNGLIKVNDGVKPCCGGLPSSNDVLKQIDDLEKSIPENKKKCDETSKRYESKDFNGCFQGTSFICFETEKMKNQSLERFCKKGIFCKSQIEELVLELGDQKFNVSVKDAVPPMDVLFENQKYVNSFWSRVWRYLFSHLIMFLTFIVCFISVTIIYIIGQNIRNYNSNHKIKFTLLSTDWIFYMASTKLVSVGIVIFNIILDMVVNLMVSFRKERNKTD